MKPNYGLSQNCEISENFQANPVCQTHNSPQTLLWGDSFAMHIARALPADIGPFVQATMSGCAPAIGIAQINAEAGQTKDWAERCIAFNDAVMGYLDTHPEIRTVILSSVYSQVLDPERNGLLRDTNQLSITGFNYFLGRSNYEETINRLRSSGRRVILIGTTPTVGIDLAICTERREMGLLTLGRYSDCIIPREDAQEFRSSVFNLFEHLEQIDSVHTIDIFDLFCDEKICSPIRDNVILFRDAGHISVEGAEYIRARNLLMLP